MRKEEEISHESFGMVSIHNISGYSGYLFGSAIEPNNYVELQVCSGSMIRDICDDRFNSYHHNNHKITIKMSPAQFAELITGHMGCGVPCTITELVGEAVPQVDTRAVESRKTFVLRKFKEEMNEFVKRIDGYIELVNKACSKDKLSKQDKNDVKQAINQIRTEITSNIPFFLKCWQESMDKITVDAKCEIDASFQRIIHEMGIKALNAMNDGMVKLLDE